MFDTFAISKTFARPPNQSRLESNGWKPLRDKRSDQVTALCFNPAKGENAPRLTLSRNRKDFWIIRAEVSLSAWLKGSNLFLLTEDEMPCGLDLLSEYVEEKSGIVFDARRERVTRVDFTRDFQVGENAVIPILAKFAKFKLPRYKRFCIDETTVYFKNAGKDLNQQLSLYSKYHERLAKSDNALELELARGLLRMEYSFRKKGVYNLAKSLKLKSHHANHILTKETSEKVIKKAMKQLHLENFLTAENPDVRKLFEMLDSPSAFSRVGFLYMKDKYGDDLAKQAFINISAKTLKRYQDDCNKAGILSLE